VRRASATRPKSASCGCLFSEQKRRFQQQYPDSPSDVIDDAMRRHWEWLGERDRHRYVQRARNAMAVERGRQLGATRTLTQRGPSPLHCRDLLITALKSRASSKNFSLKKVKVAHVPRHVTARYKSSFFYYYYTLSLLSVSFVRTSFGSRSFSVVAPKSGTLSHYLSVRTCTSPDTFRRHLKTHYCQQAFHSTRPVSSCASDSALLTIVRVYKLYLLTYLGLLTRLPYELSQMDPRDLCVG